MLEGVWSIHSHNTHLIQISKDTYWQTSVIICIVELVKTSVALIFAPLTAMVLVVTVCTSQQCLWEQCYLPVFMTALFMTALLLMVWQDFLVYLFTYLHDNINRWIVVVHKLPTVQLLQVTRKSMVEWPENKVMEKVLECTNLPLSSGLTL